MKNFTILFISFLSLLTSLVFSQEMSKEHYNSLSNSNKELYSTLKLEQNQRESRVKAYLFSHNIKRSYTDEDGSFFYMKDVINGSPIYVTTDNVSAALATKTNQLQVGGALGLDLDGTGIIVGIWDEGPAQSTHPEFAGNNGVSRVTVLDSGNLTESGPFNSHGTHVSGTIGATGVDAAAKGMATNVTIRNYNFSDDSSEMLAAVTNTTSPIFLSNHSYGVPVASYVNSNQEWVMGAYTSDSRTIDQLIYNNPQYLSVHSAGNNGQTSFNGQRVPGYDKLTGDKVGKNNLVIANANPTVNGGNLSLTINSSSSQGPADDLRVKPDIAADGTNLYSPVPGNGYGFSTGTSMSAPNTTGTLVLLQQYYSQLYGGNYMDASTLKGLVCHTAVDDPAQEGPDPKFGWGFLDAKASAEIIEGSTIGTAVLKELTLNNNTTYTYTFMAEAGSKLAATICWTDIPGTISSGTLNDPTPSLVNDLDLRITKDGTTFLPWKIALSPIGGITNTKGDNNVDNVERIDIDAPETGEYTLTVTHKGALQSSPNGQNFSLIISGNNLVLSTKDNALSNSLVVYPNPNKGEFTISFDSSLNNSSDVKVDIYDVSGRLVYKNTFVNDSVRFNRTISLSSVASGVYYANISQGTNSTTHKIIID
ncbi:S8 family serine peptidase [Winogradskyella sp. F6397]|uniref:S8 family serine peptidase n=1 Tax=Winogradskyella marina TaxID=2785530 RepID=A0ABS0EI37_9FLAO|nr:S8 family serine peptidase [Winogradskyella marina]MBF8150104.1 S8 family serine peptidase [Winogradskyella marina]